MYPRPWSIDKTSGGTIYVSEYIFCIILYSYFVDCHRIKAAAEMVFAKSIIIYWEIPYKNPFELNLIIEIKIFRPDCQPKSYWFGRRSLAKITSSYYIVKYTPCMRVKRFVVFTKKKRFNGSDRWMKKVPLYLSKIRLCI